MNYDLLVEKLEKSELVYFLKYQKGMIQATIKPHLEPAHDGACSPEDSILKLEYFLRDTIEQNEKENINFIKILEILEENKGLLDVKTMQNMPLA